MPAQQPDPERGMAGTAVAAPPSPPSKAHEVVPARRSALASALSGSHYIGVLIGLLAVCVALSIAQPDFLTGGNWANIIRTESVIFVLGIGMTLVVLTGGLDLSVASIATAAAIVLGEVAQHGGSPAVIIVTGIAAGAAMGLINGLLIGVVRIPFFVVTLGSLSVYSSLALLITNGQTISLFSAPNFTAVSDLANGNTLGVPTVAIVIVALYAVVGAALHFTRWGRSIYAFGSNPEAARLSGINTSGVLVLAYTMSGLFAGAGAVLTAGRLTAAGPQVDPNLMLVVIAAVLIGGTAFSGGEGGLIGTIVGVLFLGIVQNGLSLLSVSAFWQGAVSGAILIGAVGIGVYRQHGLAAIARVTRRDAARPT